MARTSKQGEPEGAGIDAVLDGLESVVKELESGDLPLERALERFEEGVHLARKGGQILDAVEARVERLLADRDEVVPLDAEAEEGSP
jgi:exodeoxyribonuclease VII small subunit